MAQTVKNPPANIGDWGLIPAPPRDLAGILLSPEEIYASQTHYAHKASRITGCRGRLVGEGQLGDKFY